MLPSAHEEHLPLISFPEKVKLLYSQSMSDTSCPLDWFSVVSELAIFFPCARLGQNRLPSSPSFMCLKGPESMFGPIHTRSS